MPVEVIKEVPVPVERVVYKEVLVPVDSSHQQMEHRQILGESVRPSTHLTSEHMRSPQVS